MTDLKTLILVIEQRISIAERNNQMFVDLPYDTVGDAIAMLKEQQQQIWELQDQVEYFTDKLKEQEELLRKLGKDKDKLCLEVSEWKHKFHDAPPKFVSQGVVDQIRWERDTALSQLEQIGKGLGSKMDDIVAMLQEQEAVVHPEPSCEMTYITDCCCDLCGVQLIREDNYCRCCGKRIEWEGR